MGRDMQKTGKNTAAKDKSAMQLAEVTFRLLTSCQEKEMRFSRFFNLNQAEFRCLRYFNEHDQPSNKEMASRMNLSASRLTRILDGLVRKGFIDRVIDSDDRRHMKLSLSVQGVELMKKMNKEFINIHNQILEKMNDEERLEVIQSVQLLLSAVQSWLKNS